jgi:hypothetical protein
MRLKPLPVFWRARKRDGMSISGVILIWLLFNLMLAAWIIGRDFVGPALAGSPARLTMIDHHAAAVGGDLWKSDAIEIWRDHEGELQQSLGELLPV